MSDLHGIGENVDDPTEPVEEPLPTYEQLVEEYGEPVGAEPTPEPQEAEPEIVSGKDDPISKLVFDPKHNQDFEGLMHLGELRHEFAWAGHTFLIRTLKVDELLQVALLTRDFAGTYGADRAYVTALVAACLVEVDGEPVYMALGSEDGGGERVAKKYAKVKTWYSQTIDAVYSELQKLEARVNELLDAMGEPSG
jgi:hypothetical protein